LCATSNCVVVFYIDTSYCWRAQDEEDRGPINAPNLDFIIHIHQS